MDLENLVGGDGGGVDPQGLTTALTQLVQSHGGVEGLVGKLRAGGLGDAVDSWTSTGANQPADPQRVAAALGPDTINQLAASSGLSVQSLLPLLATLLPIVIDHLTPGGNLPKAGGTGDLGGLGGLIGSVLGGGGLGSLGGMLGGSGGLGGLLGGNDKPG
jgi:uncharacterized protein YidB (DUF937 family)